MMKYSQWYGSKKKKKSNKPPLSSEVGCLATVIPLLSLSVVHCAIFFLFNFGLYNRQISLFTFLKKSERSAISFSLRNTPKNTASDPVTRKNNPNSAFWRERSAERSLMATRLRKWEGLEVQVGNIPRQRFGVLREQGSPDLSWVQEGAIGWSRTWREASKPSFQPWCPPV